MSQSFLFTVYLLVFGRKYRYTAIEAPSARGAYKKVLEMFEVEHNVYPWNHLYSVSADEGQGLGTDVLITQLDMDYRGG